MKIARWVRFGALLWFALDGVRYDFGRDAAWVFLLALVAVEIAGIVSGERA